MSFGLTNASKLCLAQDIVPETTAAQILANPVTQVKIDTEFGFAIYLVACVCYMVASGGLLGNSGRGYHIGYGGVTQSVFPVVFWVNVLYILPHILCVDAVHVLFYFYCCFNFMAVLFIACVFRFDPVVCTIKQAGYIPRSFDERDEFKSVLVRTKWFKKTLRTYEQALSYIRNTVVPPSESERCFVDGHVLCVFKLRARHFLIKFRQTGLCQGLDDAFAMLANEIYMLKFGNRVTHQSDGILSAIQLTQSDHYEDVMYSVYLCVRFWQTRQIEHLYALFRLFRRHSHVIKLSCDDGIKRIFAIIRRYFLNHRGPSTIGSGIPRGHEIDGSRRIALVDDPSDDSESDSNLPEDLFSDILSAPADESSGVLHQSGVGFSTILGVIHSAKNVLSDRGFVSLITVVTGAIVLMTGHKYTANNTDLYGSFNGLIHHFVDHVTRAPDYLDAPRSVLTVAENALECVHMLYKRYVHGEYILSYDEVTKFHEKVTALAGTTISGVDSGLIMVDYTDSGPLFDLAWRYHHQGCEVSYSEMIDIISRTYADGKKLMRTFHTGHAPSSMNHIRDKIEKDFVTIEKLYNKMTKDLSNQTSRVAPFASLIHGASGIGKSRIMTHLIDVVCGVAGVPNKSHFTYTVQDGQKYWNGFTSCVHTVIFDDLGAAKQTAFDPSAPIPILLRVINDVAFVPDQAAVDDKGQHHCQPLHVIASSNYKHINVHEFMHHRGATLRRLPIVITPVVKSEFCAPGGSSLDPAKTNDGADDYHTFTVERCYAVQTPDSPHGSVRYEKVNFTDSTGVVRIDNGYCASLLDLKVFYAETAKQYFEGLWAHKRKFARVCEAHNQIVPCFKCEVARHMHVDHQMLRRARAVVAGEHEEPTQIAQHQYNLRSLTLGAVNYFMYMVVTTAIFVACGIMDYVMTFIEFNQRQVVAARTRANNALTGFPFVYQGVLFVLRVNDVLCDVVRYALMICRPAVYVGRVFNHIQRNRIMYYGLATGAFAALLYSIIRGLRLFNAVTSQTLVNGAGVPAPTNPWNQNTKDIFVGEGSRCAAGQAREAAIRGLRRRCVTLTSVSDKASDTIVAQGVFLASNVIMTVAHFVDGIGVDENSFIRFTVMLDSTGSPKNGTYSCISTTVVDAQVIRKPGKFADDKDIVYLQLQSSFNFTDITGNGKSDFFFNDDGKVKQLFSYGVSDDQVLTLVNGNSLKTVQGNFDLHQYNSPVETQMGHSGSLIIGITDNELPVIVGLHVGIVPTMFGHKPVFAYVCKRNLTEFNRVVKPTNLTIHQSIVVNDTDVSARSLASGVCPLVARDAQEHALLFANVMFLGEVKGARQSIGASSFVISDEAPFVAEFAAKHAIELSKEPPSRDYIMGVAEERGYDMEQVQAVNKSWPSINWWYYNISSIRPLATPSRIFRCCDLFFERILANLGPDKISIMRSYIRILDLDEAINGVVDDPNVGGLNMKTSTGFPFFTKKINVMEFQDSASTRRRLTDTPMRPKCGGEEISPLADYQETLDSYKAGCRSGKPFVTRYKDEPMNVTKLLKRGRRLFMNGPLSVTICIRQYYLMLVTFIKTYALDFHCVYGINASSTAWKKVYDLLNEKSLWNDGDFLAFDVNISSQLLTAIGDRIMIPLLKMCPAFDEVPVELLKIMLSDCINALVLVDNDLVLLNGMNPSGNPLTTIFNCFANVIYHMLAYEDIMGADKLVDFFDAVRIYTYGDDSCNSTDQREYNCESITRALAQYGITYTNSKKQVGLEFTPKEDIVLLQRSFVADGDLILAPLNKSSIMRALYLTDLSAESQLLRWQGVVCSLWYESFHYNDGFGEELRAFLRQVALRKNCAVPDVTRDMWLQQYQADSLPWIRFHFGDDVRD